ncbi:MAG: hypothetical protein QOK36_2402 [Gaiellales bacterium]|jgi:hypothetical protein|nr:hypothetical protein [Gaiellales bacterium]
MRSTLLPAWNERRSRAKRDDLTRESVAALRDDIAELSARLEESEASAALLPHRGTYLLLVNGFLRRLLDLHLEWIDRVEAELASQADANRSRSHRNADNVSGAGATDCPQRVWLPARLRSRGALERGRRDP